jgi:Putative zinc-finger
VNGRPCPERLLLPEALSGRLEPADEKRVMAHLQTCVTCQDAAADIEISLISLAVLKDEAAVPLRGAESPLDGSRPAPAGPWPHDVHRPEPAAIPDGPPAPVAVRPWRHRLPVALAAAAAAIVIAAGGILVGHGVLPPRGGEHYGSPVALAPPIGASDPAARGTVAVARDDGTLSVRLNAIALPSSGWYECVWVSNGESRSAGSFRARGDGVVKNVELRVAQPQDATGWDLQLVHHQGTASEIVLEGSKQA